MTTDCGVREHTASCLCDVIVEQTSTARYGLTDVWKVGSIARAMGVGPVETPADVARLGVVALDVYDKWRAIADSGSTREAVGELVRSGASIVDTPRLLGIDWEDVVSAVTENRGATGSWSKADWLVVEAVFLDEIRSMTFRQIGMRLGTSTDTAHRLCDLYGVTANTDANDRLASMREHLLAGLHPNDAITAVAADGFDASYNQLYQMRRKMAHRGEIPDEMPPVRELYVVPC